MSARESAFAGGEACGSTGGDHARASVRSSRYVYEGRAVRLRVDELLLADGTPATREVIDHPGAVVIAALGEDDTLFLVRQYRHGPAIELLELPAGTLEANEDPLSAAIRELREEVGLEATRWDHLGSFYSSPGFLNELLHAYLARGLADVGPDADDDEDITVVCGPLGKFLDHPECFRDSKTLATLMLLERKLTAEQG